MQKEREIKESREIKSKQNWVNWGMGKKRQGRIRRGKDMEEKKCNRNSTTGKLGKEKEYMD